MSFEHPAPANQEPSTEELAQQFSATVMALRDQPMESIFAGYTSANFTTVHANEITMDGVDQRFGLETRFYGLDHQMTIRYSSDKQDGINYGEWASADQHGYSQAAINAIESVSGSHVAAVFSYGEIPHRSRYEHTTSFAVLEDSATGKHDVRKLGDSLENIGYLLKSEGLDTLPATTLFAQMDVQRLRKAQQRLEANTTGYANLVLADQDRRAEQQSKAAAAQSVGSRIMSRLSRRGK